MTFERDAQELYQTILQVWSAQVESYWQRTAYFAAFEIAALGGTWTIFHASDRAAGWMFAFFSVLLTVFWTYSNVRTHAYVLYWWMSLKEIEVAAPEPVVRYARDYDNRRTAFGLDSRIPVPYSIVVDWGIPGLFVLAWISLIYLNLPPLGALFSRSTTNHAINRLMHVHSWIGISLESWLTILAVVLGPILALYAQRLLDNRRARHERQIRVFRELMITRTQRLSPRHVEALNAVPLEFEDRGRDRKVIVKWKAYLDHLNTDSTKDSKAWMAKGTELLIDMLYEMARAVGFNTDKIRIDHEIYLPQLFNTIETEQTALRQQLLEVLSGSGTRKIPIAVFETKFPDLIDKSGNPPQNA